jgi:two-component system, NarL family, nitrate/nitrite response regulator NarL
MLPLKVLIADDHRLFRQGLIGLMRTRPDLVEIVGEAATGQDTILQARTLRPDLILMDIQMPDGNGLQATACIRQLLPDTAVVMLTASEANEHVYEAVRLGAAGYLLKSLDAAELFEMLEGVARGESAMTRAMASRLLKSVAGHSDSVQTDSLTEREIDVLRLVARGASNPKIAQELCITVNTVKAHLKNILEKLRLDNRTQAAAYAVRCGMVPAEQDHPIG